MSVGPHPEYLQVTDENDFDIFASLTLTLTFDQNVAGDEETDEEHLGLFL